MNGKDYLTLNNLFRSVHVDNIITYYCLNISERQKRIGDLYWDLIGHFYVIAGSDWRSLY